MNFFNFLSIVITIFIIASTQQVCAIKCWRCSSDASNAAFCADPFDASGISEQQRRWSYVECTFPPGQLNPYSQPSDQRAVCKKVVQTVNDKRVISRSCFWEKIGAAKDECLNNNVPPYIKTEFCETCDTDGCNGVDMNEKKEETKDKSCGFWAWIRNFFHC
ncbi:uncharacterized protein LOC116351249 [Contarinia nasturtii]|uniref:uncharacterized protein LOC116351049 n=1 Tax=Contarinia nasturtii TaxID=265458 RepID=UPI0012D3E566|nr:uncharacterized protein LOC116351049 [Contarinia nasturtii]XP_031639188.1 uncharacterized protein LOC116351249 [Contarinia nasturtii]